MAKISAPWANRYLSVMKNMYTFIGNIQNPDAREIAQNAIKLLFDTYTEMGFYDSNLQNMGSKFGTDVVVMDAKLKDVGDMIPDFKKAVYNFHKECDEREIDPYLFFVDFDSDFPGFGGEYVNGNLSLLAVPPNKEPKKGDLPGGPIYSN